MRSSVIATLGAALVLLGAPAARADVSSFYALAPGLSVIDQGEPIVTPSLDLDLGIGSLATRALVLGGLFHFAPQWTVGADLGGALRLCSSSYVRGEFGWALDLGGHHRFATAGGWAASSRAVLGLPWGLFAGLSASYGEGQVWTGTLSFGVDLARATVHRSRGTDTLPSPLHQPMIPSEVEESTFVEPGSGSSPAAPKAAPETTGSAVSAR